MKNKKLLFSLAFLVVMIVIMQLQGKGLKTPVTQAGIVDLEFAKTPLRANECLAAWPQNVARINTYIDFIFIISYVLFLVTALKAVPGRRGAFWVRTARVFVFLVLVAGLFDCLENIQMLRYMGGTTESWVIYSTYWLALSKFLLLSAAVLFLLFGWLARRRKLP